MAQTGAGTVSTQSRVVYPRAIMATTFAAPRAVLYTGYGLALRAKGITLEAKTGFAPSTVFSRMAVS